MNGQGGMQLVREVAAGREQNQAQRLAASRGRLTQAETRLRELQDHHDDYQRVLVERMRQGLDVVSLRDHQAFLARLAQAIQQQTESVMKARQESDAQRRLLTGAAQRTRMIDKVIERRATEQRRLDDARHQRETDERALRTALNSIQGLTK